MTNATKETPKSQVDRFKEAARELECDEDEGHWDERLKKVVKQKSASSPDTSQG